MLRSNHGAVHATIDQLLTMSTDLEAEQGKVVSLHTPLHGADVPDVVAGAGGGGGGGCVAALQPSWDGRGGANFTTAAAHQHNSDNNTWMDDPPHLPHRQLPYTGTGKLF